MTARFAPTALMLGNIVTGCSIMAPAGMLNELSDSLDVSIRTAGLLITFGAVVLCVGSPVTAWLTGRIERRRLLTATLAVLAITVLQMSGQFTIFTFMGPLLKQLTGAGADAIGLVFALYGGFGFVGS